MEMLQHIRRLAAIFRQHAFVNQAWVFPDVTGEDDEDDDRISSVREPKPILPGGRLGAIAVDEPDPETSAQAVGRRL
jgi:hypothetical protein